MCPNLEYPAVLLTDDSRPPAGDVDLISRRFPAQGMRILRESPTRRSGNIHTVIFITFLRRHRSFGIVPITGSLSRFQCAGKIFNAISCEAFEKATVIVRGAVVQHSTDRQDVAISVRSLPNDFLIGMIVDIFPEYSDHFGSVSGRSHAFRETEDPTFVVIVPVPDISASVHPIKQWMRTE